MARRRRSTRRRRRTRRMRRTRLYRPIPIGIPQSQIVKLRYNDTSLQLNPSGLTPADYVFRCNSIYDPNYTALGHQPMWHDLYSQMYRYYTVLGSKITVRFVNDLDNNLLVGVYKSELTSGITTSEAITENKASRYKYLTTRSANASCTITDKFSAKRWFRAPVDTKQRTLFGNNPDQVAYWHVWAEDSFKNDISAIAFSVTIEYIVKFSNPLVEVSTN